MVMFMKENGRKTKRMAMVFITTLMEPSMRANGEMTNRKVLVEKNGQTIAVSKVCIRMVRSMVMVDSFGLMELLMKAIGLITRCTVMVFSLGLMVDAMKELMKMTRNMASVSSPGLMDVALKACGIEGSKLRMVIIVVLEISR